jgi:hypothetical protein
MFSSNDRAARDKVVDDLKKKISDEKKMLERHVDSSDKPQAGDRPYRAKKLSEVFELMGF